MILNRLVISLKLLCNFIEIALWRWCSSINLLHILRTFFIKTHLVLEVELLHRAEEPPTDKRKAPWSVYTFLEYLLKLDSKEKDLRLHALASSFAQDFLH